MQTGENCISIDGREHTLKEAADFAYRIAAAINMVRIRGEVVHAGERMAHYVLKD